MACPVGSVSECESQLALAQANYDSYDGNIKHDESIAIGQERESIAVVLGDPDGSLRQADQEFLDQTASSIPLVCTVVSLGACASISGTISLGADVVNVYNSYEDNNKTAVEFGLGKVALSTIGEGINYQIDSLPNAKARYIGKTLNGIYSTVSSTFAEDAINTNKGNELGKN
ncbi:hypothetical protein OH456_07195 [Vibrio sp. La 4.2.2]|uniref:hypothetical protein n=1 Tax=Vibrio sp. La 4.2.2 TaxID=2998830 RepID=UPI0022CDCEE0|nr:hypothetical protein [Vibrio sp. La 4.2.2]MDA0107923.1 hypothetical protein [Vibrio sp. La 4.2.2]